MTVEVGDFRDFECPPCDVVIVDPPFGLGKVYAWIKETTPFAEWVTTLYTWAEGKTGWLVVFAPYKTIREWLLEVPEPTRMIMWHKTFITPGPKNLTGWLLSLTPILVYNFGGTWYGPALPDRNYHDCIDSHSAMGDIKRQIKLGIHERMKGHPGVTGTQIGLKLLRPLTEPGDLVVDPMMGSGSLLVAAQKLDCRTYGMETVPEWAAVANDWLRLEKDVRVER